MSYTRVHEGFRSLFGKAFVSLSTSSSKGLHRSVDPRLRVVAREGSGSARRLWMLNNLLPTVRHAAHKMNTLPTTIKLKGKDSRQKPVLHVICS